MIGIMVVGRKGSPGERSAGFAADRASKAAQHAGVARIARLDDATLLFPGSREEVRA